VTQSRPTIVFIITDQQRFDTIAALGYPYVDTPNLDRLAREGTVFSNAFVSAPSCAPSRASLFTGYYPHTTGIFKNADTWRHSWVERLADAGYHCVNVGKMHSYPFETPLGFHERFVVENKDRYLEGRYFFDRWDMALQARGLVKQQREFYRQYPDYGERLGAFTWDLPPETHPDRFVGGLARWWVEQKPPTTPLFLQVGFPGPHPPYDPTPEALAPYLSRVLPVQGATAEELAGQPPALRELRIHNATIDHDSIAWSLEPTLAQLQRLRAHYLANVTMIDAEIGGLLDALEARGYLENAVVVFTSDHGDCLGDHGHIQKWTMYDAITRVPLIVWAPSRFAPGRQIDALCQQMDIGPALLELAGLTPPTDWQAESLLPLLHGEPTATGRERVFSEHPRDGILTGTAMMTMVRERDWKLVHYVDSSAGELYDLRADPQEQINRWGQPAYADRQHALLDALLKWRITSSLRAAGRSAAWR
jgi:arylsulfatase A-like enzyme